LLINESTNDIVKQGNKSTWSELYRKEDYWTIWLGFTLIISGLIIPPPNPPTNIDLEIAAANEVMQTEAERSSFRTLF